MYKSKHRKRENDVSPTILVEGKKLYTNQLVDLLYPQIYKGLQTVWYTSKVQAENWENDPEKPDTSALAIFQDKLQMVRKWSDEIISNEYNRIIEETNCDYYDDLITAVIVSHVKVLSSIRLCKRENPIELKVPSSKNFIHKCYIESSRKFIENPFLMEDRDSKIDYIQIQKNLQEAYKVISSCIVQAIQKILPTKEILHQNLQTNDSDNESVYSNDSGRSEKLKNLVRQELDKYIESESEKSENSSNYSDDSLSNVSSKPFKNTKSPDLDVSDEEMDTHENTIDLENEPENNPESENDSENDTQPLPMGEDIDESSVKQVIVPANKKLAAQKKAEETILPEIQNQIETNPNLGSDNLFLSDAED